MDKEFIKSLFSEKVYPDFSKPNIESIYELGKWFFEYFSEINMNEGIFTFPVITLACSIIDDKYGDEDFIEWICNTNNTKAIGNVYTGEPTSLSSCCRLRSEYTKMNNDFINLEINNKKIKVNSNYMFTVKNKKTKKIEKIYANELEENYKDYLISFEDLDI